MNKFIFDVDGTLTPSRGKIDEDFRLWLCDFLDRHAGYIVTGSDQAKTIEQIGAYCYNHFVFQFQCSGNQIYYGTEQCWSSSDWTAPEEVITWLKKALGISRFPYRTGRHIETRPGTINFSIVGRNATPEERAEYVAWDQDTCEREFIAYSFNDEFNKIGIQAQIGGETGIDITPIGRDKSQILTSFHPTDTLYFFGDACQEGGNDYPLAKEIMENDRGFVYNVKDYKETWKILKEIDLALSKLH